MGGHLNVNHLVFLGQGALWTIVPVADRASSAAASSASSIALARISPLAAVRVVAAATCS